MKPPETYLFVPGNRPERFDKAVRAMPDAVILDLEDARVLAAAERSHAVQVDGKMVDLPLIEQAQRVLRAAAA